LIIFLVVATIKIWRNILSVRKWLWPTKKRQLWIFMMKLR
jgi:hypothetical protein